MTHSFTRNQVLRLISGVLIPCYSLTVCLRAYATDPTAAVVSARDPYTTATGLDGLVKGIRGGNSVDTDPVRVTDQLTDLSQYIWVPGNNRSWVTFTYDPGARPAAASGTSSTASTYYFGCQHEAGRFVIAWAAESSPGRSRQSCATQGARINVDTQQRAALPESIAHKANPKITASESTSEPLPDQQAYIGTNPFLYYCTVAAKDRGWWLRWGTQSNPCQEAEQLCAGTGAADDCKTLSQGEWRAKDENLFLAVVCAENQIYTARGNGLEMAETLLPQLAQQADAERSKACAVNVYRPSEVIATPVTNDETLIQASSDSGALVVDVLAGSVLIRSAQQPTGELVRSGERYSYPQNTKEAIDVSEVAQQSPLVQIFLNPDNWPPNSADAIRDYQASLGDSGRVASDPDRPRRRNGFLNFLLPVLGFVGAVVLGNELSDQSRDRSDSEESDSTPSQDNDNSVAANTAPGIALSSIESFGRYTKEQTITVNNTGSAPLTVNGVTIENAADSDEPDSDNFTYSSDCINSAIAPGGTCTITITFKPALEGNYKATLTINSNAADDSEVELTGDIQPIIK